MCSLNIIKSDLLIAPGISRAHQMRNRCSNENLSAAESLYPDIRLLLITPLPSGSIPNSTFHLALS